MKLPFLLAVLFIVVGCTNKIVNSDKNDSLSKVSAVEESVVKIVSQKDTTRVDTLFPGSWEGKWGGTLEIFKGFKKGYETPMELHILPDADDKNKYSWHIIYGEDKVAGLRPYDLYIIDPTKGLYKVDENNSIAMESYYFADKFVSLFEVQGSILLSSVEKRNNQLIWEIFAGNMEPVSITGDTIMGTDTISAVQTFPINVMQRAVLSRM